MRLGTFPIVKIQAPPRWNGGQGHAKPQEILPGMVPVYAQAWRVGLDGQKRYIGRPWIIAYVKRLDP